jgi:hypothetical protein
VPGGHFVQLIFAEHVAAQDHAVDLLAFQDLDVFQSKNNGRMSMHC